MSATAAAPTPTVFIGVLSFNGAARARLRDGLRRLYSRVNDDVGHHHRHLLPYEYRFVLPAQPDLDADAANNSGDVLLLQIPLRGIATVGKYCLQNAFFKWAHATLPMSIAFIARADDDAVFNPNALAHRLAIAQDAVRHGCLAYGAHAHWYMWHPESMMPSCWAYSLKRWADRRRHRRSDEACLVRGLVGPFPFAAGPLVAYSRPVVRVLVSALDAKTSPPGFASGDEAYVLGGRRGRRPLLHPMTGAVMQNSTRAHWLHRVLLEDVYYAYLLFVAFANRSLALVDVSTRAMPTEDLLLRAAGAGGTTGSMDVAAYYHPSKKLAPLTWLVSNRSARVHFLGSGYAGGHGAGGAERRHSLACDSTLGNKHRGAKRCCAGWESCRYVPGTQAKRE